MFTAWSEIKYLATKELMSLPNRNTTRLFFIGSCQIQIKPFVQVSVWPNVQIKSSPKFSKSCLKSSQSSFYLKSDIFNNPKNHIHLGNFWKKIWHKESANLVTLGGMHAGQACNLQVENLHYLPLVYILTFPVASKSSSKVEWMGVLNFCLYASSIYVILGWLDFHPSTSLGSSNQAALCIQPKIRRSHSFYLTIWLWPNSL